MDPLEVYRRDYSASDATDWSEEEMARHTPAQVFDRSQATAKRRAEVAQALRDAMPFPRTVTRLGQTKVVMVGTPCKQCRDGEECGTCLGSGWQPAPSSEG